MIQSSLATYRHELLLANLVGISILQQHGSADDNVPAFHSRRLSQLICQQGHHSRYVELEGKGHWFDGVMTTAYLHGYYEEVLAQDSTSPELPHYFEVVTANPADLGSRGGFIIDQLVTPGQLGRIEVKRSLVPSTLTLKTSNILRFHFSIRYLEGSKPRSIQVDGSTLEIPSSQFLDEVSFMRSSEGSWKVGVITQRQVRR